MGARHYVCYFFNRAGKSLFEEDLVCANDDEAKFRAGAILERSANCNGMAIWEESRHVYSEILPLDVA